MKIVHVVQHYMPGHTYQENYLPAEMKKLGHEVSVISGVDNPEFYTDAPHQPGDVIRDKDVSVRYAKMRYRSLHTKIDGLYDLLTEEKPDLVFVHGFLIARNFELVRYANRHPDCAFCADTHETYLLAFNACFSGTLKDRIRRILYFRIVYRLWRRQMEKRYSVIFYVTPPRRTYAVKELGFSEEKLKPLWLGAELESLPYDRKAALRGEVRARLNIPAGARILILAGKLDEKKRPVELAEAFARLDDTRWWLVYVGSVEDEIRARIERAAGGTGRVRYTGFLPGEAVLEQIAASDLAVYPGAHSVLWEQTACLGIPAAFHEPEPGDAAHLSDPAEPGAVFLKNGSAEELYELLKTLTQDETLLVSMGERARKYGEGHLSYTELAKRAISLARQ
ncbi:MAG: glycosyltransferase family 4 protein [Christensenella sp.]|nr:glycosyltransferase family 4 protein [Christensenella sp.]